MRVTDSGWNVEFIIPRDNIYIYEGDGVAQLVEHRLEIQRPEVRTLSGAQETFGRVFQSQNVVLTCRCAQPLCVCTYKNDHVHTLRILQSMSEFSGFRKRENTTHRKKPKRRTMAARFSLGKLPEFSLHCIGTRKVI